MTVQLETVKPETEQTFYTVKEFLALEWPNDGENEYELIEGEIVAGQGVTSGPHGDVVTRIATALNVFAGPAARANRRGRIFSGSSTNLGKPEGKNLPKPDVSFVLNDTYAAEFEGPIPVAPDIVVEVNSPSDTDERRFAKLKAYREAGVKLIWSIHMLEQYVVIYRAGKAIPEFVSLEGAIDGGEVLSNFSLPLKELFD